MRKMIAVTNMTLDGFCDHTATVADDELHNHYSALLRQAGLLIYGRKTYLMMQSYWPALIRNPSGEQATDDFAREIDRPQKLVYSRTLKDSDPEITGWNTLLKKEIRKDELLELKRQPGKDIMVGSPSLIVAMARLDLLDEYQLVVQPIILGSGLTLFQNIENRINLQLDHTRTFGSGAVLLSYTCEKTP